MIEEDNQKKQKKRKPDLHSRIETRDYIVWNYIACLLVYFVLCSCKSLQKSIRNSRRVSWLMSFLIIKINDIRKYFKW